MAKSPYTITRRQPGSCAAYTRKLTYQSVVYLYLTFCRMQRGDFMSYTLQLTLDFLPLSSALSVRPVHITISCDFPYAEM